MRKKRYGRIASGVALAVLLTGQAHASGSAAIDNDMLNELKRMIEAQQAQIDQQAAELAALKEQLAGNSEALAAKADKEALGDTDRMVTSSFANVNVGLYGHLNRAMLFVDNGDSSKWFPVDNSNSQSRLGLRATVDTTLGWQFGGLFEYGIASNASSAVNSENTTDNGDNFILRWAEVSFKHDRYGKLSLGKGDTASNAITEVDLSGTTVASYSSVSDMAGASLWYDGGQDTLADVAVKNIFNSFDGLSRQDRIRYDTASFAGFSLGTSGSSGDGFDAAIRYNRKFGETKVAAAFGGANPGDIIKDADSLVGGSVSILLPMGFNATFASAYKDLKDSDRDNPVNWWGKLGYQARLFESGITSFSIDYGETADLRANDETGKTWSLAAVHDFAEWATEFYLAYRGYSLDSNQLDADDIHAFWSGARIKF